LRQFEKEHADRGVKLLAINTSEFEDRSEIGSLLERHNLDLHVLYGKEEGLNGYDHWREPALYVIDRQGRIAYGHLGFHARLAWTLRGKVLDIVEAEPGRGRPLLRVVKAPERFSMHWHVPLEGVHEKLAIASPTATQAGEIALLTHDSLDRVSATGEILSRQSLRSRVPIRPFSLQAVDVDGDGTREWLVGDYSRIHLLDRTGEPRWVFKLEGRARVLGTQDQDGDGKREILVREGDRLAAISHLPERLWQTEAIDGIMEAARRPDGTLVIQTTAGVRDYSATGMPVGPLRPAPGTRRLKGSMELAGGPVDLFGGRWYSKPGLGHDLDGDGQDDVVVNLGDGLIVFDQAGREIIRIDGLENSLEFGIGDLDGRPGEELAVLVGHYGLVVLGMNPR
jgi:hypothetical protein